MPRGKAMVHYTFDDIILLPARLGFHFNMDWQELHIVMGLLLFVIFMPA